MRLCAAMISAVVDSNVEVCCCLCRVRSFLVIEYFRISLSQYEYKVSTITAYLERVNGIK